MCTEKKVTFMAVQTWTYKYNCWAKSSIYGFPNYKNVLTTTEEKVSIMAVQIINMYLQLLSKK